MHRAIPSDMPCSALALVTRHPGICSDGNIYALLLARPTKQVQFGTTSIRILNLPSEDRMSQNQSCKRHPSQMAR